jgi:acyl-CoA dehydrogenase
MTIDLDTHPTPTTAAVRGADLLEAARQLGPTVAERSARHDDEGTFVSESFELLRRTGYLASPVPAALGGGDATIAEVAWAQHELAQHDSSTALASSMHLHVVLTTAWGWRHAAPRGESLLRRVVDEGAVVVTTGGGDFTVPTGQARRVPGGWRVNARKAFVSAAPAGTVATTWAVTDDGEAIGFGFDLADPAATVVETWDALGMRGTASHDVVLDELFVADDAVAGRRMPGEFVPPLAIAAANALPVIAATYLGVATASRDAVVDALYGTERADDAGVRRTFGLIDQHLHVARWTLAGVLDELGTDPEPTIETMTTVTLAKRAAIDAARAVGDLAMDVVGGRSYRHGHVAERAWRDLRAGPFHPLENELALRVAGAVALGRPVSLA